MALSIHQPSYFPWLGLLHKIWKSDQFILLDEVNLSDSAFQNRNLFLTAQGNTKYLTIPFTKKNYLYKPFNELLIADNKWQIQHFNFIHQNYKNHPFYESVLHRIEFIFKKEYEKLIDVVFDSMKITFDFFNINTIIYLQSELSYDRSKKKGDLVIDLIKTTGAKEYLSGSGAKSYMDESAFGNVIKVSYDNFNHPVYTQKNAKSFVSGISSLDALFNLGQENARKLLF